jgi:hypothetical protein
MNVRNFAVLYGIVFLAIGILGFVPGITTPHDHPDVAVRTGLGLVLGLFAVNVLHNIVHIVFGLWGLAARSFDAARLYAKAVAIIYALLTVMGFIPGLNTTFGLIPLYGHDVWLHAVLAAVAAYFGWARQGAELRTARS